MPDITHVAVDYDAIGHNLLQVRGRLAGSCQLMAVVSSNGYGRGLVETAQICAKLGANMFGVAEPFEGVRIREAGIHAPILVLLPLLAEQYAEAVRHGLAVTITTEAQLQALRDAARETGTGATFHIYVDSGIGMPSSGDELPGLMRLSAQWPQVRLEGVYTRFDSLQPTPTTASLLDIIKPGADFAVFAGAIKSIAREELGRDIMVHAADSTTFLGAPGSHLDMVRIGSLLYGLMPPGAGPCSLNLRCTAELRTRVVSAHRLPPRATVAGGFVSRRDTLAGVLPVGLYHGWGVDPQSLEATFGGWLRRHLRGPRCVLVGGKQAPVIGRIGMRQCFVDLTDIAGAEAGSGAVVPVDARFVNADVPRVGASLDNHSSEQRS